LPKEKILGVSMTKPMNDLEKEAAKISRLLKGKTVKIVRRHRVSEIMVEFDDGTRLFVNQDSDGLEFSITGGE
jgi:hypothetical protein